MTPEDLNIHLSTSVHALKPEVQNKLCNFNLT